MVKIDVASLRKISFGQEKLVYLGPADMKNIFHYSTFNDILICIVLGFLTHLRTHRFFRSFLFRFFLCLDGPVTK